ncbi:hypothetical protein [Nonomuraea sp. NPDC049625]|uniref:hypothetical protein n=1 Tax=Nonomuraea sp. NPDC049625 TaxID=3155775 RepID=UPI00343729C7
MRGDGDRQRRGQGRERARARVEEIERDLADEDSAVSRSVRKARRIRNAGVLGGFLPVVAVTAATGSWLAPFSWPALITGVLYAGLLFVVGLATYAVITRYRPRDHGEPVHRTFLLVGALFEAVRLALVTLLHADVDEAVWLALGYELTGAVTGLAMGTLAVILSHTDPLAKDAPERFPVGMRLVKTASSIATQVGFTLLLAWSPWLVFVTAPAAVAGVWLGDKQGRAGVMGQLGVLGIGVASTVAGLVLFARLG